MTSEDRICLSNVKNKLGVVTPCCQPVKGVCYPLCHRHFKRSLEEVILMVLTWLGFIVVYF